MLTTAAFAGIQYDTLEDRVKIQFDNNKVQRNNIQTTLALPYSQAEIEIDNCSAFEFTEEGKLVGKANLKIKNYIEITNSFRMRDLYGYNINIKLIDDSKNSYKRIDKLNFTLKGKGKRLDVKKISSVFKPIYSSIADNYESSYLNNNKTSQAKMLIICNEMLQPYLTDFTEWKKAKGIICEIATLSETGSTNTDIKDYIQTKYDNEENPPSYLLIIGDVDDAYAVPSFYYGSESNVSDHPYSLLEGDDYFPDLLVGRFSIDSPMEMLTMVSKVLKYEKTPYLDEPGWLERSLLVAGNYSSTPPIPTTPVKVSRWLREKLLNYGYTQADTVFYPPTYPGTSNIISLIDNGVGFVNYRGWGDANGWHYPYFHRENIEDLNNGLQLPVITSYVCNTGDFANDLDPCFGEEWLREGMPSSPKGGVVFVGPSDLHTSTKFNNSLSSGFYYGLLEEGIHDFGLAVLRGKFEMYDNFPLIQDSGEQVEFYFYVYNILGDPSLQMWTKIPQGIQVNLPQEVNPGADILDIECTSLENGIASAVKEGEFFNSTVLENGSGSLQINPVTSGDIVVTITGPDFIPFVDTIEVVTQNIALGLEEINADVDLIAGENIVLAISLKNYGSGTSDNTSAILSSSNQYINITSSSAVFGDIEPGTVVEKNYQFSISAECPSEAVLEFNLDISNGTSIKFHLNVNSLLFELEEVLVNGSIENLQKGLHNTVTAQILNIGSLDAMEISAYLQAFSDAVVITDSVTVCGNIMTDEVGQAQFGVYANSDSYDGRGVPFEIKLIDEAGRLTKVNFNLEIGVVDSTAPTGPDKFGYYAYDSNDLQYDDVPTYQWYELDPEEGGSGTVIEMPDDRSNTIALPFEFKYYDNFYDSITVCTNGWLSFETTWMSNFRNWNIPSALGPYAQVSPFWDDLIGEKYTQNDTIYHKDMRICYDYIETEDIFVIEWNGCYNRFDDISPEKFEVVLYNEASYPTDDGNGIIQFNYHTINNPDANNNYSTVGIENPQQSDGLLYTYANNYPASCTQLQNELAIKFTTNPPDNYYAVDEEISEMSNFYLQQNYPNPVKNSTNFEFAITKNITNKPVLKIYNIKGKFVRSFDSEQFVKNELKNKISYSLHWDCTDFEGVKLPDGVYFYKVKAGKFEQVRKMVKLK